MDEPTTTPLDTHQCVVLSKNGQKFVFRYIPGSEAALISQLMDLADDEACPIGWVEVLMTVRRLGL